MEHQTERKPTSKLERFIDETLIFLGLKKKKRHRREHYTLFKKQEGSPSAGALQPPAARSKHSPKSWWDVLFKPKHRHGSRPKNKPQLQPDLPKPSSRHRHRTKHQQWWDDLTRLFQRQKEKPRRSRFTPEVPDKQEKQRHHRTKRKKNFKTWFKKYFRTVQEPLYNFLYFLNLRPVPYDPFLEHDRFTHEDTRIMRIQRYMVYAFNSIILYIIAYITAYLIYQLAVIITAAFFDIDSVLYYYEVMFPIGNASPKWTQWNIITITLAGPLVSLLGGLFWYRVMMRRAGHPIMRLFYLWLAFHSVNMFFGAFVAGVITDQGFGYVANWLYFGIPLKMLFSLIALGIQTYIGWRAARHVLATSNSPQRINRRNRPYFILNQTILPWLIGSLLMLWIKIPNRMPQHENIIVYDSIILGAMAFLAIAPMFNWRAKPFESKFSAQRKKTGFVWAYLLVAILLILLYRFGLERGLHFVIKINISVNLYR